MLKLKQRSIMQLSDYCFAVTIPKIWLDSHGLSKKNKLDMYIDNDSNLVLKPAIVGGK